MRKVNSSDWGQRYEDLRAHALGSLATLHSQAQGLVVFVQQGMRGWMRAWQDPPPDTRETARFTPALNPSLESTPEATLLLTNMTLRCLGLSL
jgi:hypothetical protein